MVALSLKKIEEALGETRSFLELLQAWLYEHKSDQEQEEASGEYREARSQVSHLYDRLKQDLPPRPWRGEQVRTNSAEVCPGDAFVALSGERFDGHAFIYEAVYRGANLIIARRENFEKFFGVIFNSFGLISSTYDIPEFKADRQPAYLHLTTSQVSRVTSPELEEFRRRAREKFPDWDPEKFIQKIFDIRLHFLFVEDTVAALGQLGRLVLEAVSPRLIVAITGSNGKTSTRQLLTQLLEVVYPGQVGATRGNFNNEIGLPLTLLALSAGTKVVVLEMGMNHAGEISRLSQLAGPHVALITNIGSAHIEFFKDQRGIAEAKFEITHGLRGSEPVLVVNGNNPPGAGWLREMLVELNRERTRAGQPAVRELVSAGRAGLKDIRTGPGFSVFRRGDLEWRTNIDNPFILENLSLCLDLLEVLFEMETPDRALDPERLHRLKNGRLDFILPRGRYEVIPLGKNFLIDDTYNANPESVRAGLESMAITWPDYRRWAILGEIGELGEKAAVLHREVGRAAARVGLDRLWTLGGGNAREILEGFREEKNQNNGKSRDRGESRHFSELAELKDFVHGRELFVGTTGNGEDPRAWVALVKGSRAARMEQVLEIFRSGRAED